MSMYLTRFQDNNKFCRYMEVALKGCICHCNECCVLVYEIQIRCKRTENK